MAKGSNKVKYKFEVKYSGADGGSMMDINIDGIEFESSCSGFDLGSYFDEASLKMLRNMKDEEDS